MPQADLIRRLTDSRTKPVLAAIRLGDGEFHPLLKGDFGRRGVSPHGNRESRRRLVPRVGAMQTAV
jgi:hypothetical protein